MLLFTVVKLFSLFLCHAEVILVLWKSEDARLYPLLVVLDISAPARATTCNRVPTCLFAYPKVASLGKRRNK